VSERRADHDVTSITAPPGIMIQTPHRPRHPQIALRCGACRSGSSVLATRLATHWTRCWNGVKWWVSEVDTSYVGWNSTGRSIGLRDLMRGPWLTEVVRRQYAVAPAVCGDLLSDITGPAAKNPLLIRDVTVTNSGAGSEVTFSAGCSHALKLIVAVGLPWNLLIGLALLIAGTSLLPTIFLGSVVVALVLSVCLSIGNIADAFKMSTKADSLLNAAASVSGDK
jgi:hypothetical protein